MMTLEQFRATGTDTKDIGKAIKDESLMGAEGRIYLDGLYIEHWVDDRSGIAPANGPTWTTTLFTDQPEGTLEAMEEALYEFAKAEGWIDL